MFNSRMEVTEERCSKIDDRTIEIIQSEQNKEKKDGKQNEQKLGKLWNKN